MYQTKIKSIKKIGKIETYDLHTPKYNNFLLSNGVLSHNSGKSYLDLSIANSWYESHFDKQFPIQNCCFSIGELMKRLTSKDLKKGELLILEEAGVNVGALDFQNRIAKVFTYVLQSFRNMNIGILFNLPVLTMFNKSARQLIHAHFITKTINYKTNESSFKAYFRQLNQQTGKIYDKFLRVRINNRVVAVKQFKYSLPPQELIDAYERKKINFVADLTENFSRELDELDKENMRKLSRNDLSDKQQEVFNYLLDELEPKEVAEKLGITVQSIYGCMKIIKRKGFAWKKAKKRLGNQGLNVSNPISIAN